MESVESFGDAIKYIVHGTKNTSEQSSSFTRMSVLEARAAKRASFGVLAFLPVIYFTIGFVLGRLFGDNQHVCND